MVLEMAVISRPEWIPFSFKDLFVGFFGFVSIQYIGLQQFGNFLVVNRGGGLGLDACCACLILEKLWYICSILVLSLYIGLKQFGDFLV